MEIQTASSLKLNAAVSCSTCKKGTCLNTVYSGNPESLLACFPCFTDRDVGLCCRYTDSRFWPLTCGYATYFHIVWYGYHNILVFPNFIQRSGIFLQLLFKAKVRKFPTFMQHEDIIVFITSRHWFLLRMR
jgi:hypothetical protein